MTTKATLQIQPHPIYHQQNESSAQTIYQGRTVSFIKPHLKVPLKSIEEGFASNDRAHTDPRKTIYGERIFSIPKEEVSPQLNGYDYIEKYKPVFHERMNLVDVQEKVQVANRFSHAVLIFKALNEAMKYLHEHDFGHNMISIEHIEIEDKDWSLTKTPISAKILVYSTQILPLPFPSHSNIKKASILQQNRHSNPIIGKQQEHDFNELKATFCGLLCGSVDEETRVKILTLLPQECLNILTDDIKFEDSSYYHQSFNEIKFDFITYMNS